MQIIDDTLIIRIESTDSLIWSEDTSDCRKTTDIYKMNINDIEQIKFQSFETVLYDQKFRESYIEFIALRYYPLFNYTYKGEIFDTEWIKLRVINQEDTTYFKKIESLLKNHIDLQKNFITPTCAYDELEMNSEILAIENNNLEEPIKLNNNDGLEIELRHILSDYLESENIMKLFGEIVITEDNKLLLFHNEQNEMYNYLKTLDTIPAAYRVMKETAFFKITDGQKERITEMLKMQEWIAGKCNDKSVKSYFDFHIDNPKYRKIDDKKH